MTRRARLVWVAVGFVLLTLLLGRLLAVSATERLWAEALGIGASHADITRLKVLLHLVAFVAAAAWCSGNLYVVYRSVGVVSVPRHVGDLRFLEAVPRAYLAWGVAGLSLLLAAVLSQLAGDWWYHRALAASRVTLPETDPILGRSVAYYLFDLPWQRRLHEFVAACVATAGVVSATLYGLAGAVRVGKHGVTVTKSSRVHLGALLVVGAVVLYWGFRLDPAEYVGGVHAAQFDAVLTEVRLPTAKLLGVMALVTAAATVLWMWFGRSAVLVAAWSVLLIASLLGRHLVPGFASSVRSAERLALGTDPVVRRELRSAAYALNVVEKSMSLSTEPNRQQLAQYANELQLVPIWDPFAVRTVMNRWATSGPHDRFSSVHLSVYPDAKNEAVPVYLAVRDREFSSRVGVAGLSWAELHTPPFAYSQGVVAIHAGNASSSGKARFIADLDRPDTADTTLADVVLHDSSVVFGPAAESVAFVDASSAAGTFGVPVRGMWRRLAFAWMLQRPELVSSRAVPSGRKMLRHRSVRARLDRVAPFAQFGEPYPVVADRRLWWIAPGYVTAEAFPLAPPVTWRERTIRYLRAGFVGVVDAVTGETSVYLSGDPDPVGQVWGRLLPSLVQRWDAMPSFVREHVRYPVELFAVQAGVIRRLDVSDTSGAVPGAPTATRQDVSLGGEPFWWVGRGVANSTERLRVRAKVSSGEPQHLSAILDGSMQDGIPELSLVRFDRPLRIPRARELLAKFGGGRVNESMVAGAVRPALAGDGALSVLAAYLDVRDAEGAPVLAEVVFQWGSIVERGPSLQAALRRAALDAPPHVVSLAEWNTARGWFERMDAARRIGDWAAFAQAYEAFRSALSGKDDPRP